ncbi:Hypothetical predicted protein [Prunus dulcis]|uniref:Uncharacterized protein n=1 Tax=Prunus dulcis TaxID=3755 RepID=A0A5E4FHL7_PRUDU|nr:Hypothetical predicted protein [Prunus dulcis]
MDSNSGFPVDEFAAMDVSGFETAFEAENCGVCSNVFATSWADERDNLDSVKGFCVSSALMDFFWTEKTLLQPVNDVAVCCNVFKMRTAEEQLRLIEKCLRSFGKKMVYVVWKIRNGMNNKLVHAEIPDEPHVPFDRAVQIAGGFREAV